MKNLLIIGARGFGREIYNLALDCGGYNIKGFLDDKKDALDEFPNYPPIISSVEDYIIQKDDVFICALGDVHWKRVYAEKILAKGGEFISLVHPSVKIATNTTMGFGCIICKNSIISCDVRLGNFVTVQPLSDLGHDVVVGDWSHLNTHCFMGGGAKAESEVTIHTGGIVLPHITIGTGAVVGAGSVVIKKVLPGTTVFGVPALKIK